MENLLREKDYKNWHGQKAEIHNYKSRPFFSAREIWFSSLGENIGFEQDGGGRKFLRPVLILRKFSNDTAWILPLTRTNKPGKYYFRISPDSIVILSQIRLIDAKRLQYKAGFIQEDKFVKIKEALIALF